MLFPANSFEAQNRSNYKNSNSVIVFFSRAVDYLLQGNGEPMAKEILNSLETGRGTCTLLRGFAEF